MIRKRLLLASRLLRPDDGVLVVTIDEHEVNHLSMLLEEVFPTAYRQMVTMVVNPKGVAQGRFSRVEEHALFCFCGSAAVVGGNDDHLSPEPEEETPTLIPRWAGLLRSGTNARRQDRKDMFYAVLLDPERGAVVDADDPLPLDKKPNIGAKVKGMVAAWPIRRDLSLGNWGVGPKTLRHLISRGYVSLGGYDPKRQTWGMTYLSKKSQLQIAAGTLEVVSFDERRNVVDVRYAKTAEKQIKTVWHRTAHDAGAYGSGMLKDILGQSRMFPFPKSLYCTQDVLAALTRERPKALIVDFFAGSGTTMHAVARLNTADGGARRCLLVTNNEVDDELSRHLQVQGLATGDPDYERHGICEAVCWPRCRNALQGRREDGTALPGTYIDGTALSLGFAENAEYFRLEFLDPHDVARGEKFAGILPILWLMAGAKGEREKVQGYGKWFIPKQSPFGVLLQEQHFRAFRAELHRRPDITHVFLVTDSPEAFREMVGELSDKLKCYQLYKSYLENFRINMERSS